MNTQKNYLVLASIVLGLSFIIGVFVLGNYLYSIRSFDNSISVSGSAREKVVSDTGKLSINISKKVSSQNISSGYQDIKKETDKLLVYLIGKGIDSKNINTGSLSNYEDYQPNSIEKIYNISNNITVSLNDVYLLDSLSKEIPLMSSNNLIISVSQLEFYYSKLSEVRVSLIQKAIEDAKDRANKITEATNISLGKLKSAGTGVVQVLSPNSNDVSDYGTYDTSTIEKEIVITVKANFSVK
jgi:hypothetical protein